MKITLKEGAQPKVHYKKTVPWKVLHKLKGELENMLKNGVITKVDYSTELVNNVKSVEKEDGRIRVCLDPRPLNECIRREEHIPNTHNTGSDRAPSWNEIFYSVGFESRVLAYGIE